MMHTEPGDARTEQAERLRAGRDCACKHWDARACYQARYPNMPVDEDSYCECYCHDESDEDE